MYWRENAKKSFDWNLGPPQTKHWSPKTCQSLSNPFSLSYTALRLLSTYARSRNQIVQYTLRYYCNSTLLKNTYARVTSLIMIVQTCAWKVERDASLVESYLELVSSSSVTNNHSYSLSWLDLSLSSYITKYSVPSRQESACAAWLSW